MMLFLIEDPLHPLLKEPVAPWDWENVPEDPHELIGEMKEIMFKQNGVGLSANQVGIPYAMFIMRWQEEDEIEAFFNPRIVNLTGDNIVLEEGCLSYPGKGVNTNRYRDVIISTEQSESDWYYSGASTPKDSKGSWEKEHSNNKDEQIRLLESVCVQHEIDHLNGVICMDRKRDTTIVKDRKVGRNEPCPCGSGKKYKKCCIGK